MQLRKVVWIILQSQDILHSRLSCRRISFCMAVLCPTFLFDLFWRMMMLYCNMAGLCTAFWYDCPAVYSRRISWFGTPQAPPCYHCVYYLQPYTSWVHWCSDPLVSFVTVKLYDRYHLSLRMNCLQSWKALAFIQKQSRTVFNLIL